MNLDYSQFADDVHWRGIMAVINTADAGGRKIVQTGRIPLARQLPLSLRYKPADWPGHDGAVNVGSINKVWLEGNYLWGQGRFDFADPTARDVIRKIRNGFVRHMSADIEQGTYKLIATTILDTPAFEQAQFTAIYIPDEVQSLAEAPPPRRELVAFAFKVVGDMDLPLADRGRSWDSAAAVKRIAAWASEAGELEPARYRRAFFYQDPDSDPAAQGSYKLPYADVINGDLVAIPKAIQAVAGALQGARGGVDIAASDAATIKRRVSAWYRKMSKKFGEKMSAPWDKDDTFAAESEQAVPAEAAAVEQDEPAKDNLAARKAVVAQAQAALAAYDTVGVL